MTAIANHVDLAETQRPAPTLPCKGLESLASETLFSIITQLPDLISLDSLLRASPVCLRLFDEYAIEIFETILVSRFTHGHVRAMVRIIAHIRSGVLPIHSLDEFKRRVTHEAMNKPIRPSKDGFVPQSIPEDTSPAVLRGLLVTNRRIMCLAIDCIKIHLSRFKDLRPEQLVDKKFCYKTNLSNDPEPGYIPMWESRPEGKKIHVRDPGPPFWVEEQRVIRALWRVQILTELKKAEKHSLLDWPKGDIEIVRSMDPVDLYFDYNSSTQVYFGQRYEFEEINTVMDFMRELPRETSRSCSDDDTRIQLPRWSELKRDWPTPLPCDKDCPFREDRIDVSRAAYGHDFYYVARMRRKNRKFNPAPDGVVNGYSPLHYIPFAPFRRLGFAIWSTQRMSRYGFVHRLDYGGPSLDFVYFTWLSVLSEDEYSEVERRNKADYLEMLPIMDVERRRFMRDLECRDRLKEDELRKEERRRKQELHKQEMLMSGEKSKKPSWV